VEPFTLPRRIDEPKAERPDDPAVRGQPDANLAALGRWCMDWVSQQLVCRVMAFARTAPSDVIESRFTPHAEQAWRFRLQEQRLVLGAEGCSEIEEERSA